LQNLPPRALGFLGGFPGHCLVRSSK